MIGGESSLESWLSALDTATERLDDARYILGCRDCLKAWPYQRDSKTVKAARDSEVHCPKCEQPVELIRDAKASEQGANHD